MTHRIKSIYALRVYDRKTGKPVEVVGAHAKDVIKQDDCIYGKYPESEYTIIRYTYSVSEIHSLLYCFSDLEELPDPTDPMAFAKWAGPETE